MPRERKVQELELGKMEGSGREQFFQGMKDCVPTLLGYLSIGFAAGVVERTAGLSMMEIFLLSTFLYAGSAQFVVAAMITAGSPIASVVITVLFINSRHLLLSAALSPFFRKYPSWNNALLGAQLTDETFGVASTRLTEDMKHSDKWMLGLNMTAHLNWVIANIAGAYFGAWIPDPERYGLHFALPAMFIGLLVLQLSSRKQYRTDLMVVTVSVVAFVSLILVLPGNISVIIAIIAAAFTGMVVGRWK